MCDNTPDGRLAAELHQSAAYRFRISEDDVNIEYFLEHLYELQLMLWIARRSSLPHLLPGVTANASSAESADAALARVHLRAYQLLHDTCGDCSGRQVHRLWQPLLRAVSAVQPVVPIFTLNYDWAFEKLAIEGMDRYQLVDGFELLGGSWNPARFAGITPQAGRTTLALFKLHGSTSWLPGGPTKSLGRFQSSDTVELNTEYPPYQFEMVYPAHAHEKRFGKEYWDEINPVGASSWETREPYQTLYRYFSLLASGARLIIVIGYGFHDPEVNETLGAAMNAADGASILVVDPGSEHHRKATNSRVFYPPFYGLEMSQWDWRWSRVTWLGGRFGDRKTTASVRAAIGSLAAADMGRRRPNPKEPTRRRESSRKSKE